MKIPLALDTSSPWHSTNGYDGYSGSYSDSYNTGYESGSNSNGSSYNSEYHSSSSIGLCYYYRDENGNYTIPEHCDYSKQYINSGYCYHGYHSENDIDEDMIAVFWDNTDIRKGNGRVYAREIREENDPELLYDIYMELQSNLSILSNQSWYPHSAVIATWENVQQFDSCNKVSS